MTSLLLLFRAWLEMRRFNALSPEDRAIVFYSEDNASWVHFESIIKELIGKYQRKICYLTSSSDDPILKRKEDKIRAFFIGGGIVRTKLFHDIQAGVMVMTMPDLENYYLKRSRKHPVHYVHVPHNLCSTHMVFRHGAYDHYDTVFCVGPFHIKELRAAEEIYHLKPKTLVKFGNVRLDSILSIAVSHAGLRHDFQDCGKRLLVAPSYGNSALLEVCGIQLVEVLVSKEYHVTVRPHPLTVLNRPDIIAELTRRFGSHPNFVLETDVASQESLHASDLMISDWSGAAQEYAFGLERPVLFIDVPRKINNPEYKKIPCEPFEVIIRSEVGVVVSPDHLDQVPKFVDELCNNPDAYRERIRQTRSRWIFNVGKSGAVGADYIAGAADGAMHRWNKGKSGP